MTSGRRIMRVKCSECRKEFPLNEDHTCGGNNEITEAVVNEAWKQEVSKITVKKLVLAPFLVAPYTREDTAVSEQRCAAVYAALTSKDTQLDDTDVTILRELFGPAFLTDKYYLREVSLIEG